MWSPTHIQVTVQRAKGLLIKGKNGTNNCFITIGLGKEKYQTSIKDKASRNVDWHEECELTIPDHGNRAELILTCFHRNSLGLDEFLGQVILPLNKMDVYERPRSKWYKLESKPGKEKKKDRGEIEVRILFVVKSGSLTNLNKKEKHKSSLSHLASSVGESLLSLGAIEKKKKVKQFAKSLSSKIYTSNKSKNEIKDSSSDFSGSFSSINTSVDANKKFGQTKGDADPGVISEDEDEFVFEKLSHKSSGSSLNINKSKQNTSLTKLNQDDIDLRSKTLPLGYPAEENRSDEWQVKLYGKNLEVNNLESLKRRSWETPRGFILSKHEKQDSNEQKHENNTDNKSLNKKDSKSNTITQHLALTLNDSSSKQQSKENFRPITQSVTLPRSNTTGNLLECLSKENEKEKTEKNEKRRFGKLKYFRKDKHENHFDLVSNQCGERIIVGHESHFLKSGDKIDVEISKDILRKYEGKSREEIILFANGLENELCFQRQKIKELEDYLDNLLLRVMETHPKILQNPYDRNTSTKSG